ncbi:hypothetical protein [Herpetosiphon gulosus]|uniref:Uncharacterized protein n=1 Tax=Herpetosiphon gulosus TaxID=1973496 RepID=A0ABP9WUZ7_9CHLR
MNHDLAAVLDYLDQRFGSSDRQAFEERLAQEPQLRELLEKTKSMQRNLRSIFGQSERLVAPSQSRRRVAKFSTFKHTINALMLVVLLLGGVYLKKQFDLAPQISNEPTYLALANEQTSLPQQQMLLLKGIDHEQNHFVRAMQDDQMMWQANNVEALLMADNGDRIELSKTQAHYVLTRRSGDDNPLWQQSLPFEPDTSMMLGLYQSSDQQEIYLIAYTEKQANQPANMTQPVSIIPHQQTNLSIASDPIRPLGGTTPDSISDILDDAAAGLGSSSASPTNTPDPRLGQSSQPLAHQIMYEPHYVIIDSTNGTIKHPNQQCDCRYLASNQTLYRYEQAFPFTNYVNYAISASNPNLLNLVTSAQDVIIYDLKNQKILNSTKLASNQQLNDHLYASQLQLGRFGQSPSISPDLDRITDIQFSGNQQTIIIRDSTEDKTTFYAFDRLSGQQLWKRSILASTVSFTPNWDGTEVYAIHRSKPTEAGSLSTLYTVQATKTTFIDYPQQQFEEIMMVYDF